MHLTEKGSSSKEEKNVFVDQKTFIILEKKNNYLNKICCVMPSPIKSVIESCYFTTFQEGLVILTSKPL